MKRSARSPRSTPTPAGFRLRLDTRAGRRADARRQPGRQRRLPDGRRRRRRRASHGRLARDRAGHHARRAEARDARQPRAVAARRRAARRALRAGPRRRDRHDRADSRRTATSYWLTVAIPPTLAPLHRPQGIDRRRRHQPDRRRSSTTGAVRRADHPVHLGAHESARAQRPATRSTSSATSSASTSCARSRRSATPRPRRHANRARGSERHDQARRRASKSPFAPIEDAIDAIRDGEMIIVVDDEDRENEGDLTIAAEKVTPEAINFMAKHGRGLICMPMTEERLDELEIPLMVAQNTAQLRHRVHACRSRRRASRAPASRPAIARRRCWRRSIRRRGPSDLARPGPHVPAAGAQRRRAGARRADRSGRRSRAHRRAVSGRRHLRNHERRRHDGARAGAGEVREAAQAADDHDRRSDPVPDAHRGAGAARRVGGAADRARRVPRHRVRERASTARPTSRWSRARSATARTCWCASTRAA